MSRRLAALLASAAMGALILMYSSAALADGDECEFPAQSVQLQRSVNVAMTEPPTSDVPDVCGNVVSHTESMTRTMTASPWRPAREQRDEEQGQNQGDGQEQQEEQAERNPQPEYTVGQTAQVGNVEWTITDAYRTTQLRSDFGTQKQGNFVVVDFTFTNNRSEEVTLDPELHMILKDSRDREFGTDPDAWEFVPTRLNIFLEPVNPGLSQDGRAIYEVPPDARGFVLVVDDVEFWEDQTARYDLGSLPTRG